MKGEKMTMTVGEAITKLEHLDQIIENLRADKNPDKGLLADLLQEYYDIIENMPTTL